MLESLLDFHFIRPLWLLGLIPLGLLFFILKTHQSFQANQWHKVIDPELLKHLLKDGSQQNKSFSHWLWLLLWVLICFGLAGPTFKKLPSPVIKNQDGLVIILDLSYSMMAQDVKPDRLTRAKQKITDILRTREDGQTALVVYAGSAFAVTPLTDDTQTISNLLPAVNPMIMPNFGSRADKSIALAKTLIKNAGLSSGQLLLISDGINQKQVSSIKKSIENSPYSLSIIGIGSQNGAPIPLGNKGFLRDDKSSIVMAKFDSNTFDSLASSTKINWAKISLTDSDWQGLLSSDVSLQKESKNQANNYFDKWQDMGHWLVIPACFLCLLFFRRGYQLVLLFMVLGLANPQQAWAFKLDDMFKNKDQKGHELLEKDPKQAAKTFNSPMWQGISHYKAKDYQQAAQAFSKLDTAEANYNRGNALAQMQQYQQSIDAYKQALEKNPNLERAKKNLQQVEEALKKQKQQQKKKQKNQEQNQPENQKDKGENQQGSQQNSPQSSQQKDSEDKEKQNQEKQQSDSSQNKSEQQNKPHKQEQNQDGNKSSEQKNEQEKQAQRKLEEQKKANKEDQDRKQQAESPLSKLSKEEKAAMQQWLNKVPDKPGTLLQRKFEYQYKQRQEQQTEDELW